jgi:ABC-type sugar transport system ATPase subunit
MTQPLQTQLPILQAQSITKTFGAVTALKDVNFAVHRASVHALVGENGAGKSTLMKILAGSNQPDSGQIILNSKPLRFQSCAQALENGISMIYQELDLAEHLTVAQNVFLGNEPPAGMPFIIDSKKMNCKTAELIKKYGFDLEPTDKIENLSTAHCQIVELLRALRTNARIIVMDEPTSSLSRREADKLLKIVRNLTAQGVSVIYISHKLEEVTQIADQVTVLRDGKVVHSAPANQLDIPQMVHHMVGRELKDFYPPHSRTTGQTVFRVKNLSTSFLKDISFDLKKSEIVGLAGLVGAGRTELARAIFGIDKPTAATIEVDNEPVEITSPRSAVEARMAYLTEDRKRTGLCLNLPCAWNITLPCMDILNMKRIIRPAREKEVAAMTAEQLSVKWPQPSAPVRELSGGNQQKVLIARWLLANSKVLIFDEPTRGIDIGAKKEVYQILNNLAEAGKAVLFISSELPELLGITDRILVMRRGKLAADLITSQTNPDQIMHFAAVENRS